MPGYSDAAKNSMLDHLAGATIQVSLHDGDPGTTGAFEISGDNFFGEPYTRKTPSWSSASGGEVELTADLDFDGPPGQTVTHFAVWGTGDVYHGGGAVTGANSMNAEGKFRLLAGSKMDLNAA